MPIFVEVYIAFKLCDMDSMVCNIIQINTCSVQFLVGMQLLLVYTDFFFSMALCAIQDNFYHSTIP